MGSRPRIERLRLSEESSFYEVLGELQFLNNSERAIYLKLRDAVEKALAPEGLFDFENVAAITYSLIEIHRFKRAQVALINSPAVLADLLKLAFGDNLVMARQVALHYFGNDPKKAAAAGARLEQKGISHLQIEGHAIVAQSDKLQSLDRLVQFREASNNRRMKEIKKRQKKRADKIERPRLPRIVSSDGD